MVASNAFGMVTSKVARVVVRCVAPAAEDSAPPFADWRSAATNLQDAIDVALPGDFVLVTNGVFNTGGKVLDGITNRVAIEKSVALMAVNGPSVTIIQGTKNPGTTNGPAATRCVYIAADAVLNGFTCRDGATGGTDSPSQSGGGVLVKSGAGTLLNCILTNNSAFAEGGGASKGILLNCRVQGNSAGNGGGLALSSATNCLVSGNYASTNGGGIYLGMTAHCNLVANFAENAGGGVYLYNYASQIASSIIYYNKSRQKAVDNMFLVLTLGQDPLLLLLTIVRVLLQYWRRSSVA